MPVFSFSFTNVRVVHDILLINLKSNSNNLIDMSVIFLIYCLPRAPVIFHCLNLKSIFFVVVKKLFFEIVADSFTIRSFTVRHASYSLRHNDIEYRAALHPPANLARRMSLIIRRNNIGEKM